MKRIPLTQGKFALVDDEDFEWLNQQKWIYRQPSQYGHTGYAICTLPCVGGRQKREYMHRLILGLKPGDKQNVDHINHNGLNNCRCNIRICTQSQNGHNRQRKPKGVYRHSNNKCWWSEIWINWKRIYLGVFKTKKEAIETYQQAKKQTQVRTNDVPQGYRRKNERSNDNS